MEVKIYRSEKDLLNLWLAFLMGRNYCCVLQMEVSARQLQFGDKEPEYGLPL